jgi:hypothetical protein
MRTSTLHYPLLWELPRYFFRIERRLSKTWWLLLFFRRLHIIHQIRIFSPRFRRGGFCFGFALWCEFCAPALFWSRLFPGLDGFLGHPPNSPPCGRSVLSILTYDYAQRSDYRWRSTSLLPPVVPWGKDRDLPVFPRQSNVTTSGGLLILRSRN